MSRNRIDQESIQEAEQHVQRMLGELSARGNDSIEQLWTSLETTPVETADSALQMYFIVLAIFQKDRREQRLKNPQKTKLKEVAERCLRYAQILPVTSQHSSLYARLYQYLAWDKLEQGQLWESVALRMSGEYLGRDARTPESFHGLLSAYQAWMLGHTRLAKITLHGLLIEEEAISSLRGEALNLLVRIHRIADEAASSRDILSLLRKQGARSESERLSWELAELLCDVREAQGAGNLLDFWKMYQKKLPVFEQHLAQLWLYASKMKFSPLPSKRPGMAPSPLADVLQKPLATVLELVECMDYVNQTDLALHLRFERLGKHLGQLGDGTDPELALVFVAAALRWLNRSKQQPFAAMLLEEYRALSLRVSEGRSQDALGFMADIQESLPILTHKTVPRAEAKLYTGFTPRFLKLSMLITKAMARLSLVSVRHPLRPEQRRQQRSEVLTQILRDVEHCLAELKGPLMKLCQTLAAFHLLSDKNQAVLREVFRSAPAVPFASLRPILEEDLGSDVFDRVFPFFHLEPLAVASLGEVFRAQLRDGRKVAVKVRYPDIDHIIRSDLRLAKLLSPLYGQLFFEGDIEGIVEELDRRFAKEIDYQWEASVHQKFYEMFQGDARIAIPEVHLPLCTSRILVTEFIEGPRLDEFLETSPPEQRATFARHLLWFSMVTGLKTGVLQIDPHLGNMLVQGDRLVMLDFGASYVMSPGLLQGFRKMMLAKYRGDLRAYYEAFLELGYMKAEEVSFEMYRDGPGPLLLAPFAEDRVRPYFLPGQKTFVDYVLEHRWDRYFNPPTSDFFALMISQYMEDLLHSFHVELNWHEELGHVLRELGLLSAQDVA